MGAKEVDPRRQTKKKSLPEDESTHERADAEAQERKGNQTKRKADAEEETVAAKTPSKPTNETRNREQAAPEEEKSADEESSAEAEVQKKEKKKKKLEKKLKKERRREEKVRKKAEKEARKARKEAEKEAKKETKEPNLEKESAEATQKECTTNAPAAPWKKKAQEENGQENRSVTPPWAQHNISKMCRKNLGFKGCSKGKQRFPSDGSSKGGKGKGKKGKKDVRGGNDVLPPWKCRGQNGAQGGKDVPPWWRPRRAAEEDKGGDRSRDSGTSAKKSESDKGQERGKEPGTASEETEAHKEEDRTYLQKNAETLQETPAEADLYVKAKLYGLQRAWNETTTARSGTTVYVHEITEEVRFHRPTDSELLATYDQGELCVKIKELAAMGGLYLKKCEQIAKKWNRSVESMIEEATQFEKGLPVQKCRVMIYTKAVLEGEEAPKP